jgi:F-type H+-transporting ATP synthase subunit e
MKCPILTICSMSELGAESLQVLRWSALVAGIFYGFTHQRTIYSRNAAAHQKAEYDHKAELISKAKAEWAKKHLPPQSKTASGDSMCYPLRFWAGPGELGLT